MSTSSVTREPSSLLSPQKQSAELGKGAAMGTPGDLPPSAMSPVELLKRCQQLTKWKCDLQKRIYAAEVSMGDLSPELLTEEHMTQVVKNLEKEVDKLRTIFRNKRLVLDRLHVSDVMFDKIFEKSTEAQLIGKTMEHSTDLSILLIQSQEEISILEEQLMEVKKKRMHLAESSSTMMAQFKKEKENPFKYLEESDNSKIKNISKRLSKERDVTTVLQNVFQRLIIGSCANWAEDPKLREVVPKLGKSADQFV
ncbi:centromere protein H isoform X1 [Pseudophryne corroboree]|uniref:centromere protein H isoform X1 n=1 Tax=Pseudophryne corroboree TaxID=495146 RepID=UPI0030813107